MTYQSSRTIKLMPKMSSPAIKYVLFVMNHQIPFSTSNVSSADGADKVTVLIWIAFDGGLTAFH